MEPCDWGIDLAGCAALGDTPDPGAVAAAAAYATEILWALSGRRFGLCDLLVRPNPPEPVRPSLSQQAFAYAGIGSAGPVLPACTPAVPRYITLTGPVHEITEVIIDGAILDPSGYQLTGNRLWRRGDTLNWPPVQDMDAPPGDPGTWTVAYVQGRPLPEAGRYAANTYACELYKAMTGAACALPQRVTDITREGITMTVLDPADFLDKGRTGINTVDMWLTAVNPHGLASASVVWSPDVPAPPTRI